MECKKLSLLLLKAFLHYKWVTVAICFSKESIIGREMQEAASALVRILKQQKVASKLQIATL